MPIKGTYTQIYLDSGSAVETRGALGRLGFLDGQTTNPTFFAKKNPDVRARVDAGERFTRRELLDTYRGLAVEISSILPDGSVSIEVYADQKSTPDDLMRQAREMNGWIPNAHIKLPITAAGLRAAEELVREGVRVNMTLCFSQQQAAAVHAATRGADPGQVYVSPFISRLDKRGENGFDLLLNIQQMYRAAQSPVSILAASVHDVYDIARAIEHEIDIVTVPYEDLMMWVDAGTPTTVNGLEPKNDSALAPIIFELCDHEQDWSSFSIKHELTDQGLERFAKDWNDLLSS